MTTEETAMPAHELHPEIRAVKQLQRRLITISNQVLWRQSVRKRATMISIVLRRLLSLVSAEGAERSRTAAGWGVSVVDDRGARHAALELVTYTKAHTFDDLAQPLPLRVLAPSLVVRDRVDELAMTGMTVLVLPEVT
jgi:hypothetical protein